MSGVNWSDLPIVIFDAQGHVASIQKSILRGSGARKVAVAESVDTLHKELIFGRDIVVINWTAASDDFASIIDSLRRPQSSPDPYVGIILVAPATSKRRIELALASGADSLLGFPFRPVDFTQHIARLVLNAGPFIETDAYCGPDRRRRPNADYAGTERRAGAACRTLTGADLAAERRRLRSARMPEVALG
jgi:hypothetical protein